VGDLHDSTGRPVSRLIYIHIGINLAVARAPTTSDFFNAVADVHRREILDVLIAGEKAVGAIVDDLPMSQPQVSKHLRVLSEVGLVTCRAEGRRRLYRLEAEHLRALHGMGRRSSQIRLISRLSPLASSTLRSSSSSRY
jgi:DNA-binding transcriptional ArsR family regulator